MADSIQQEMISAFASGCMDNQNYKYFTDYIKSGGELPEGALGEIQNIMALVPTTLKMENPDKKVKSRVAKRLMNLQKDKKNNIKEEKKPEINKENMKPPEVKPEQVEQNQSPLQGEEIQPPLREPEKAHAIDLPFHQEDAIPQGAPPPPPPPFPGLKKQEPEETDEGESTLTRKLKERRQKFREETSGDSLGTKNFWIPVFVAITLFVAIIAFVFYMHTGLSGEVTEVRKEIKKLREDSEANTLFRNNYLSLIEFFSSEGIETIKLYPVPGIHDGYGRLMINFEERKGLLQLENLPSPGENRAFQLWFYSGRLRESAGVFSKFSNAKFREVQDLPRFEPDKIDSITVTSEPVSGSVQPTGRTFLKGYFSPSNALGKK